MSLSNQSHISSTQPTRPDNSLPGQAPSLASTPISTATIGDKVAEFRGKPFRGWTAILLLLGGIGISLGSLLYGVWRGLYGYTQYGSVPANTWGRSWIALGAILALVILLIARRKLQIARRRVVIYQNGIRLSLSPRQDKAIYWRHIGGFTVETTQDRLLKRVLKTRQRISIYPNAGKPFKLDDRIQDLPALIEHIETKLFPFLLSELRDSFQAGRWLHFGPLAMNQQTLQIHKRQYAWEQVKKIDIQAGRLVIEFVPRGKTQVPTSKIPNLVIMLQIIEEGVYT